MAWQLIYSSAPRLLDAGLTGFGTVARHRAIPPLVVKAVERISQFARLPGYQIDRIIFCHRTLTVGGSRFHVLSRLRDAGSDYSGRTNHIAHHLVVSAQEVAQLAPGSATPADILLQMAWRDRWDAGPEWLHDDTMVPLQRFVRADSADRAWESVTGDPAGCWLLVNGKTARSACVIYPAGTDPLHLFAASQHGQQAADAWQSAFTTALQPTDEPQEFRWIGIAGDSPLRGPMESSGRPLIDLTNPASLPRPELPQAPAAQSAAGPGSHATSAPLPGSRYTPPAPTVRTVPAPDAASRLHGRKSIPLGEPSPRRASRFLLPALIGITAAAAGTAAFLVFNRPNPPTTPPQADASALIQQINAAKSLDDLRKIKTESWQQNTRAELIERIQKLARDPAKHAFDDIYKCLTEIREQQANYVTEDPRYDYAKDSIREILEAAALASLEQSRPPDAKVNDQVKRYEWMLPAHAERATALTRPPEPAVPAPSTAATPAVATAPTPPPAPTPAPTPPPTLRTQRSIVASFDDLESLTGPVRDDTFWDQWKSNVEIRRDGQLIPLVADATGSRFTERNKAIRSILTINGPDLKFSASEIDSIEALILTDNQTRWEITTKPPAAPRLPAAGNLVWNPKEGTFTFTGKSSETLSAFRLHGDQSLQFILNHPRIPPIDIKNAKSDSLLSQLDSLRKKSTAKIEESQELKTLQKELDAIGNKVIGLDSLHKECKELEAAEKEKSTDLTKISAPRNRIKQILEKYAIEGSVGLQDSQAFKTLENDARAKLEIEKTTINEKQNALKATLEKEISEAKAVVAEFGAALPYGGAGKVYLVTAGGARAGSKESPVILEIMGP